MRSSSRTVVVVSVAVITVCVVAVVAFTIGRTTRMAEAAGGADARRLVWSDEFSGRAGSSPGRAWSFETGASGWGNNELECYTDSRANAALNGRGQLVITARRQPGHTCSDGRTADYTSARITTFNSVTTSRGRLEMRARIPTAPGTWPAFWALGRKIQDLGWPRSGEIDVMEADGKATNRVLGTVHGPTAGGRPLYITRTGAPPGAPPASTTWLLYLVIDSVRTGCGRA